MGFFSKKKKSSSAGHSPASSITSTLVASQAPESPMSKAVPMLRLRVAVDHISTESRPLEDELFYIEVSAHDSVDAVREEIYDRVGRTGMSVFKTHIPWQAYYQARTYVERYHYPVDLITSFPCYSLDDPSQLRSSLSPDDWQQGSPKDSANPRVQDWWPSHLSSADSISILVRPTRAPVSERPPSSFLAHFAPSEGLRSRQQTQQQQRLPPTVVDVLPSASVNELKAAVLRADGRQAEQLDKVVLWRVEMSEEELVVIEERGGLKGGRMPWPYPPTAAEPVLLEDGTAPISRYFPDFHSQAMMVNLSVWIHPSASTALARQLPAASATAPAFKYPMLFSPRPDAERRTSQASSLPDTPLPPSPPTEPQHPSIRGTKSRVRQRPSTAPAFVPSSPSCPSTSPLASTASGPPAFGASSRPGMLSRRPTERDGSRLVRASPLSAEPITASMKGLGLEDGSRGQVFRPSTAGSPAVQPYHATSDFHGIALEVEIASPRSTAPSAPATPVSDWAPVVDSAAAAVEGSAGLKTSRSVNSRSLNGLFRRADRCLA